MPVLKIERLHPDVPLPEKATDGSAGYDVRAYLEVGVKQRLIGPDRNAFVNAVNSYGGVLSHNIMKEVSRRIHDNGTYGAPSAHMFYLNPPAEVAYEHFNGAVEIPPGYRVAVPTGLKVAVPPGWELQVRPRSGMALKEGLTVNSGDRIAQILAFSIRFDEGIVETNTDRGEGGFGSTGTD